MISKTLLEEYNVPVPRYTSYPPVNHFRGNFSESDYMKLLKQSNQGQPDRIAFYIHIPFCKGLCLYCGCNSRMIQNDQMIKDYFTALKKEIKTVTQFIRKNRKVSQIHFGGGTPNSIDPGYIEEIIEFLFGEFSFIEHPEIAIESNPAYLDHNYLNWLLKSSFNRLSMGIQDFNPDVLKTVNRLPSAFPVIDIVKFLRNTNQPLAVNLDFIYGLPGQDVDSFLNTIKKAIKIKPERLVTFSYAHVPWMKKHQKKLENKGLPSAEEKMQMFLASRDLLKKSGYIPIGLDHFVLPEDELSIALKSHKLHRNFQGYCTRETTGQVYAFGVSAISQYDDGYAQNTKDIRRYIDHAYNKKIPVEKGLIITSNQKIIREAITEIMCNRYLHLGELAAKHHISVPELEKLSGFNRTKLKRFVSDSLVVFSNDKLSVTEEGALFIRNIAALFDPEYRQQIGKYSNSV